MMKIELKLLQQEVDTLDCEKTIVEGRCYPLEIILKTVEAHAPYLQGAESSRSGLHRVSVVTRFMFALCGILMQSVHYKHIIFGIQSATAQYKPA